MFFFNAQASHLSILQGYYFLKSNKITVGLAFYHDYHNRKHDHGCEMLYSRKFLLAI